jgi:hypothetical protein
MQALSSLPAAGPRNGPAAGSLSRHLLGVIARQANDARRAFGFYDNSRKFVVEPGRIDLYAATARRRR